ncbi:MAG: hypothetical protein HY764_01545 [Candidatus Portnoybacteria bacterium]|nr:hypothetical protein [Candidatus Portnoybacteria bacterium]
MLGGVEEGGSEGGALGGSEGACGKLSEGPPLFFFFANIQTINATIIIAIIT